VRVKPFETFVGPVVHSLTAPGASGARKSTQIVPGGWMGEGGRESQEKTLARGLATRKGIVNMPEETSPTARHRKGGPDVQRNIGKAKDRVSEGFSESRR